MKIKSFNVMFFLAAVVFFLCTQCDKNISSGQDSGNPGGSSKRNSSVNNQASAAQNTAASIVEKIVPHRQEAVLAWNQFNSENGNKGRIYWNKKTGYPEMIVGNPVYPKGLSNSKKNELMMKGKTETQEESQYLSEMFLKENEPLLGIKTEKLGHFKSKKAGINTVVFFEQMEQEIPVYNAYLKCILNDKGQTLIVENHFYPDIAVNINPSLTDEDAKHIAMSQFPVDVDLTNVTVGRNPPKLYVLPKNSDFVTLASDHLCWVFDLGSTTQPIGFLFFVDASDGTVLFKKDLITVQ